MSMDHRKYFLYCLSRMLNGKKAENDPEAESFTEWDSLFSLAGAHSLEGLIYWWDLKVMPERVKKEHLLPYLGHAAISFERKDLISRIAGFCKEKHIDLIFMKGAVIREYYAIPELRSMGDLDIIVHKEDRKEIDRLFLNELGFRKFVDHHDVWTYWKGKVYVEVHTSMFYDPLANDFDYKAYFSHVWEHIHNAPVFGIESENLYVPDESFHLLYLLAHTAKHIVNKGSGFRAYVDMVLMIKACRDKLDWKWIEQELNDIRLLSFSKICFSLCEQWFDTEMPLKKKLPEKAFIDLATEKTFDDGIFGLANTGNAGAGAAKEIKRMKESGRSYGNSTFLYLVKKIFPPYEDMNLVPWYRFVDGRPWLLPAAWVYRWGYCLLHKRSESKALITEPFARKKAIEEREQLLHTWGL